MLIKRGLDRLFAFFDLRLTLCSSPFRLIQQGVRFCQQYVVFKSIRIVSTGFEICRIFLEIIDAGKLHCFCSFLLLPGRPEYRRERPVLVLVVDPPGFFQIAHLLFLWDGAVDKDYGVHGKSVAR